MTPLPPRTPAPPGSVADDVTGLVRERTRDVVLAVDAYRRAYADAPQEDWFAESSAHAAAELLAERHRRP